jgi:hypothetical protein
VPQVLSWNPPEFNGAPEEIFAMRTSWNHIVGSLRDGASRNVAFARDVYARVAQALSQTTFTFTFTALSGNEFHSICVAGGAGCTPGGFGQTTMYVNVAGIAAGQYNGTLSSTMIHEFGHAWYNSTGLAAAGYNYIYSDTYAQEFENAYRGSVGACLMRGHSDNLMPWKARSCPK